MVTLRATLEKKAAPMNHCRDTWVETWLVETNKELLIQAALDCRQLQFCMALVVSRLLLAALEFSGRTQESMERYLNSSLGDLIEIAPDYKLYQTGKK